ncbi:SusC/RagA family TonB-linked outer membrane protein [Sinomicrobium kalidii]|uniref:SusC/RagA family TonB-linked outer membrane protein n=1 Tax=Sinomicrobium kalidii TaxID=2900738 RepID=UPI001E64208A|nr:SusC/RagA family TonB-linked outer membrane protein [Sinomicrobium kalidii]UGU18362.1 SusC/RagA family TonB-linked outer membrane protein [Sinomicrobium kalidii]
MASPPFQTTAQHQITGTVTDSNGEPLGGVNIIVSGKGQGTISDFDGTYSIMASPKDTLVYSYVGFKTVEKPVNGLVRIDIQLKVSLSMLDEAVVIGYGTTTKRLNTGSVGKLKAKEIENQPVTNVLSALSGRIPGVFIQTTNGLPGGNVKVQIRGRQSIAAGVEPLFVVDGVPFSSNTLTIGTSDLSFLNGQVSPLNSLSPDDIASIEVLKDADATAIYGSCGANGVILITTKKGKAHTPTVSLNFSQGMSQVSRKAEYLSLQEYLTLRREAYSNEGVEPSADPLDPGYAPDLMVWDTTQSTDWQDYLMGNSAPLTRLQSSFSGGSELTQFLLGLNYHREGSVLPGDLLYSRYGGHLNVNHRSSNKKFSLQATLNYTKDDNKTLKDMGVLQMAALPPNFPVYLEDGSYNWEASRNPAAYLQQKATNKTANFVTNLVLSYQIFPSLSFKTSLGYTSTAMKSWAANPATSQNPPLGGATNKAYFGNQNTSTLLAEPQLYFSTSGKFGKVGVLLGMSWQKTERAMERIYADDYANDLFLENLGAAGRISSAGNTYGQYKYASIFSRLNYNYRNKYLLNINLRRDGSSRFGPGNQFGNFGAIGIGWIFSEEKGIKENWSFLSFGKIRGSYGLVGNDQIPDYQYLATYSNTYTYMGMNALNPSNISNANYQWETTKKLEGTVELGFFNNRLETTFSYFNHQSDNQLIAYPIPYISGPFGDYQANLPALVKNTGWEIELSAVPVKQKSFSWNSSFNMTFPKNRLVRYPGLENSSYANQYTVGKDLSNVKGYRYSGIDPETGIAMFEDLNGDGAITYPHDLTARGKTSPDFYGGWSNQFQFKGISLDIFFQFVKQQSVVDIYSYMAPGPLNNNKFSDAFSRWQSSGDITNVQKAYLISNREAGSALSYLNGSNASLKNASYVRLKNIALRYRFPDAIAKQLRLSSVEVFGRAQNVLTWSPLSSNDPEVANSSLGAPTLRSFTIGCSIRL